MRPRILTRSKEAVIILFVDNYLKWAIGGNFKKLVLIAGYARRARKLMPSNKIMVRKRECNRCVGNMFHLY
jgi:hypothetical protein